MLIFSWNLLSEVHEFIWKYLWINVGTKRLQKSSSLPLALAARWKDLGLHERSCRRKNVETLGVCWKQRTLESRWAQLSFQQYIWRFSSWDWPPKAVWCEYPLRWVDMLNSEPPATVARERSLDVVLGTVEIASKYSKKWQTSVARRGRTHGRSEGEI